MRQWSGIGLEAGSGSRGGLIAKHRDDPEVKRVARGEVPDLETALREVHLAGYSCREVQARLRRLARP